MSSTQRRPVAVAAVLLMLLTASLAAVSLAAAAPSAGSVLRSAAAHHATLPNPVRALTDKHTQSAFDSAVLGPSVVLGLLGLVLLRTRRISDRLTVAAPDRRNARAPPTAG